VAGGGNIRDRENDKSVKLLIVLPRMMRAPV
jgi:hypothetical protein